jgi:hypothetical protein
MGHPAMEAMCNAIDSGAWQNSDLAVDQIWHVMSQNTCLPCILAKKNKPKIKSPPMDTLTELQIGELLSGDIIDKIQPPSRDGCVYFYLFVDKRSGCIIHCKNKGWICFSSGRRHQLFCSART